jgi:hypothetical protein
MKGSTVGGREKRCVVDEIREGKLLLQQGERLEGRGLEKKMSGNLLIQRCAQTKTWLGKYIVLDERQATR